MNNIRVSRIDLLRTIKIIIIIIANSIPYILVSPHSIWLRIISSLAAPLFIFLSGFSFFLSFNKNQNYRNKYFQVFYLFCSAILLNITIWHIMPFQTFDVLYLISFGLLINILIFKLKVSLKLIVAFLFICTSFVLQNIFNYRFNIPDIQLQHINWSQFNWGNLFKFRRCFNDGWTPIFPWIGIAILGHIIAQKIELIIQHKILIKWSSLFLILIFGFFLINKELVSPERQGYLELFYPPSLLFIFFELSFILLLFSLVYNLKSINSPKFKFLIILGLNSLLIYLFYALIISYVLQSFFIPASLFLFLPTVLIFIFTCFLLAFIIEWIEKNNYLKFLPRPLKSVLGLK